MNLVTAFAHQTKQNPEKTAVYWGEELFSYNQLFSEMLLVSQELQKDFAVRPGDRVGLWLKNCPQFIPALFGILQCGAVVVPINNFLKPAEVSFMLADAGINAVITDSEMSEHFEKLLSERPQLKFLQIEKLDEDHKSEIRNQKLTTRSESDLAVIIYTSGTTGRPKGAMLSHGNLLHNVEGCRQILL
ncbi:MAG: acyl--CoA ligase, partial [Verrucomicrobiota bacterium]|nr:acyl--CoA ligase [Verrucomicrobiota bacterium]